MIPHWQLLLSILAGPFVGCFQWVLVALLIGRFTRIPGAMFAVGAVVFAILGVMQVGWLLEKLTSTIDRS